MTARNIDQFYAIIKSDDFTNYHCNNSSSFKNQLFVDLGNEAKDFDVALASIEYQNGLERDASSIIMSSEIHVVTQNTDEDIILIAPPSKQSLTEWISTANDYLESVPLDIQFLFTGSDSGISIILENNTKNVLKLTQQISSLLGLPSNVIQPGRCTSVSDVNVSEFEKITSDIELEIFIPELVTKVDLSQVTGVTSINSLESLKTILNLGLTANGLEDQVQFTVKNKDLVLKKGTKALSNQKVIFSTELARVLKSDSTVILTKDDTENVFANVSLTIKPECLVVQMGGVHPTMIGGSTARLLRIIQTTSFTGFLEIPKGDWWYHPIVEQLDSVHIFITDEFMNSYSITNSRPTKVVLHFKRRDCMRKINCVKDYCQLEASMESSSKVVPLRKESSTKSGPTKRKRSKSSGKKPLKKVTKTIKKSSPKSKSKKKNGTRSKV